MSPGALWIQAVSVGEVRLALPLARRLCRLGHSVILSSTTATGLQAAESEARGEFPVRAFPIDAAPVSARFLQRFRPSGLILMETEIWPNLLLAARRLKIPVWICNGRISDRALMRMAPFRSFYEDALAGIRVAAQDCEHARRFEMMGVPSGGIRVMGNLKYDLAPPKDMEERADVLRAYLPSPTPPVWVAGSVREGEEETVLKAHALVRRRFPDARLILVPRHPERAGVCENIARSLDLRPASKTGGGEPGCDVLIVDTVGDLWSSYLLGDVAFVGGSLVPLGGQNVLEPAALGRPVLFGPSMENFRLEADRLLRAEAASVVRDLGSLSESLCGLFSEAGRREAMGLRARRVPERHGGALLRTAGWIHRGLDHSGATNPP